MFGDPCDVTLVSVAFENAGLLRRNAELVARLNRGALPRWIVVDNSPRPRSWADLPSSIEVVPGVAPADGRDRGSLHHAMGLEVGLRQVRSRHVLLMDPDFYVVRPQWLAALARHFAERKLTLFGSVWHPSWSYQYRYFPSVHFLWIDGAHLPLDTVDLRPHMRADRWWQLINDERWPVPFRERLKATRIRDTGWALYHRHRRDPAIGRECLVPHFVPDGSRRYRLEAALRRVLPESLCLYPKDESWHTTRTFLKDDVPDGYAAGWEEFFWRDEPFALHLRQVGRRMRGRATDVDLRILDRAAAGDFGRAR